jgi:hypothetical protein
VTSLDTARSRLLDMPALRLLTDPTRPSTLAASIRWATGSWSRRPATQGRRSLAAAFDRAGLADRLHLPEPGERIDL